VFTERRDLEAAEMEFLAILADTCAQNLDRIATQSAKLHVRGALPLSPADTAHTDIARTLSGPGDLGLPRRCS
jgi:hypothetical protein